MAAAARDSTMQLTLPEELLLMLINEENGYFHQVAGWHLNCAVVGAVLAELSLRQRIDTDLESLFVVNDSETGDPVLDPILAEVVKESDTQNAQYWIERLALRAESIIDMTLDRLVSNKILEHHEGGFWTLAHTAWQPDPFTKPENVSVGHFIKQKIGNLILTDEIPDPRGVIIVCLINTCDVFRFMFKLDEEAEERIKFICQMDLIGRSIAEAVAENASAPALRRAHLAKKIPVIKIPDLLRAPHMREGNLAAMFAALAEEHGPVFQLSVPFQEPLTFLASPKVNDWANRHGRMYLRTKDYFEEFEKVYGASGVLPALDGADHFRLRKVYGQAYARRKLQRESGRVFGFIRSVMAEWKVGESYTARDMCRHLLNAQISPLSHSIDTQDLFDDLIHFKERALNVYMMKVMPPWTLRTPAMKRKAKAIDTLLARVERSHTPAQRAGQPRDLADDMLSLNASDPQLMPETNLRFALSLALIVSVYAGDIVSFVLYAMARRPEYYAKIRAEADALFGNGDPDGDDFTKEAVDVTQRFVMECLRLYPIVPASVRNVMNSCVVEGYELPMGSRINIVHTAPHYMESVFPDPFKFDIDRYTAPRFEHRGPGYSPYGTGTHRCVGFRWMELQTMINVLMIAHHFNIEIDPPDFKCKISPFPASKPSIKLKFRVAERVRDVPV